MWEAAAAPPEHIDRERPIHMVEQLRSQLPMLLLRVSQLPPQPPPPFQVLQLATLGSAHLLLCLRRPMVRAYHGRVAVLG